MGWVLKKNEEESVVWEETLRSECCWDSGQETRRNERRTTDEVVEIAGTGGERLTGIHVFLFWPSHSFHL